MYSVGAFSCVVVVVTLLALPSLPSLSSAPPHFLVSLPSVDLPSHYRVRSQHPLFNLPPQRCRLTINVAWTSLSSTPSPTPPPLPRVIIKSPLSMCAHHRCHRDPSTCSSVITLPFSCVVVSLSALLAPPRHRRLHLQWQLLSRVVSELLLFVRAYGWAWANLLCMHSWSLLEGKAGSLTRGQYINDNGSISYYLTISSSINPTKACHCTDMVALGMSVAVHNNETASIVNGDGTYTKSDARDAKHDVDAPDDLQSDTLRENRDMLDTSADMTGTTSTHRNTMQT